MKATTRARLQTRQSLALYRSIILSDMFNSTTMLTLGPGLLAASGTRHKKQRKMLNPVFSAAHFRNITPTFLDVADRVRALIYALYAEPCNSPIIRSSSRLRSRHEYNTENKLSTSLVGWDALLLNLSVRGALGTRLTPSLQTTRRDTWKPSVNYRTSPDSFFSTVLSYRQERFAVLPALRRSTSAGCSHSSSG